jgi:hypothetical protein
VFLVPELALKSTFPYLVPISQIPGSQIRQLEGAPNFRGKVPELESCLWHLPDACLLAVLNLVVSIFFMQKMRLIIPTLYLE